MVLSVIIIFKDIKAKQIMECSYSGIVGSDTTQFCGWISTSWSETLSPPIGLKV